MSIKMIRATVAGPAFQTHRVCRDQLYPELSTRQTLMEYLAGSKRYEYDAIEMIAYLKAAYACAESFGHDNG